jgi:hypothetical protein
MKFNQLSSARTCHPHSNYVKTMPLPAITKYGAKQCQCKSKRTGQPCLNVAAHGCKSCRVHGAHKSKIVLIGKDHPNYKNGNETREAREERKKIFAELKILTASLGSY